MNFCKEVLTSNPVKDGFKEEINMKKVLHEVRMKEDVKCVQLNSETYNRVLKKFRENNKQNYDFLIKASDVFKGVVHKFVNRMIVDVGIGKEKYFPKDFENTTLHQIFKKGEKNDLSSFRYIHSKTWLPRTVDAVVVEEMRERILTASTPYQIGGQPKHRAAEHLFP